MFGRWFGKQETPVVKAEVLSKIFATSPTFGKNIKSETQPDPTADYLAKQDNFLKSIGPHMRHGVNQLMTTGEVTYDFSLLWDEQLQSITAVERGQLLVDWVQWHVLRAHEAASAVVITQKHPKSIPLLGHRFMLPPSLKNGSHLTLDIEFTEAQAKQFIGFSIEASQQKNTHFSPSNTKRLLAALKKAITSTDQALAAGLRQDRFNYKIRWAEPLLKLLCPLEAAAPKLEQSNSKEEAAVIEAFHKLTMKFKRLSGMWVRMPAKIDLVWGSANHQMFPFFVEISRCVDAVEIALNVGHDVTQHRSHLLSLRDIARANLHALKSGYGELRSFNEVSNAFPQGENPSIKSPYWSIRNPEKDRDVFDTSGRPKVNLIVAIEAHWLSKFEKDCERLQAIQLKSGLSKKLIDLLPSESATSPTKSWLKNAGTTLNQGDLNEILGDIAQRESINTDAIMFNPENTVTAYEVAKLSNLELRARVWAAHLAGSKAAEPLYAMAQRCYKKIPGKGPKDAKLGNAASASLSLIEGGAGVPYLLRLEREVKYPNIKAFIEKCIAETAKRQGPAVQDLKETAVNDHGFA